jgi:hypothetical protein
LSGRTGSTLEFRAAGAAAGQDPVYDLLKTAQRVAGEYTRAHDPWWPDTLSMSPELTASLNDDELQNLGGCLRKLGLALTIDPTLAAGLMQACRQNLGPWPENED